MDQLESIVPIWPMFVRPTLVALADGDILSRRELSKRAKDLMNLSDEARDEALESGGSRAQQRVGWAITHLNKAGWIERPSRAHYRIAEAGREWMAAHPEGISDFGTANRIFAPFWPKQQRATMTESAAVVDADASIDPIEQIEEGIARVGAEVVDALLTRLRSSDPGFFVEAVVIVLLAMGYGGTVLRGKRIGGTGDGGVDGVIDQDALGLDQIYVQAKRYADGNTIGRETIQAFIGALQGFGATRGVFITSSTFTANARDYANAISTRVILIDGQRLAQLMIKYRVGVQVKQSYEVVEIDEDFFE
jgi:restriction system protein